MQKIIKDKGGTWHYGGDNTYICLSDNGTLVGRIFSQHLPNPMKLWEAKCNRAGVDIRSKDAQSLKPSETVFKLWEHKDNA